MEQNFRVKKGLTLGTGKNENMSIVVDNGKTNRPELRYNNVTSEWEYSNNGVDFMAIGSSGGGSGLPPSNVKNLNGFRLGGSTAYIRWEDPGDTVIEDQTLCTWAGTKVVIKEGSAPENVDDGELVLDNKVLNAYKDTNLEMPDLDVDKVYYVKLFPYSDKGILNENKNNSIEVSSQPSGTFTVEIDLNNSDPEKALTYKDGSQFMTAGSPDWDLLFGHYPVILKNGVETVKLNPNDYTKDINGNTVNLSDKNTGDVMIAFPRRGIKIETVDNIVRVQMTTEDNVPGFSYLAHQRGSTNKDVFYLGAYKGHVSDDNKLRSWSGLTPTGNKNIGDFRGYAQALGTGYEQSGFYQLLYRQVMYILKYKNLNSQSVIGRGYVDGNSTVANTGQLNTKGLDWGETTGKQQMKLFGIEDFYGNIYEWIDGLVTDMSYNILTATTNFNDTGTGYNSYASGIKSNTGGYMSIPQGNSECGFVLKSSTNGGSNEYFCDYTYLHRGMVAGFGGSWSDGSDAGAFRLLLNDAASHANSYRGARLMFL